MQFMLLVKSDANMEAGILPSTELLMAMNQYLKEMEDAGIIVDPGNGLHPSAKGARVRIRGAKRDVIDGPFTEAKELIAGYWLFQVKSKEEAIEWIKRCPNPGRGESEIEIRQVFEAADFGPALTPELAQKEEELRTIVESRR